MVARILGATLLYVLVLVGISGSMLFLAPYMVDFAASYGYRVSEAYCIAVFLGGGIAGVTATPLLTRK